MLDILSELTVTRVRAVLNVYTAPGRTMERKNRPCFAIIYKYEGETVYECNGRTVISNAENAVVLPAGSSYAWQCKAGGHYYTVEFYDRQGKPLRRNTSCMFRDLFQPTLEEYNGQRVLIGYNSKTDRVVVIKKVS